MTIHARSEVARPRLAGVAQLVEQLIRNQQVIGSSPIAGSKFPMKFDDLGMLAYA
jgi:hypothetical protein